MASPSRTKLDSNALSKCQSPPQSKSYSAFASSITASTFFARASSPTPVNLSQSPSSSSFVRFSTDCPISPNRSISIFRRQSEKGTCLCSPTTHPGSFKCAFHRGLSSRTGSKNETAASYQYSTTRNNNTRGSTLNCRRSAMTNSLVRIGGVEGECVNRALAALSQLSSHQLRHRAAF